MDYGEAPEVGVLRELEEETNLKGRDPALVAVAGNPKRDPRRHTISILCALERSLRPGKRSL